MRIIIEFRQPYHLTFFIAKQHPRNVQTVNEKTLVCDDESGLAHIAETFYGAEVNPYFHED